MKDVARHLITTADERTWKFDRPVIFLGEWCRIYERRHVWRDMDAIVAPPYGLGLAKKDADYAEARALEERLFPELCEVLNRHHGTQHGERFWRIVLGHWLRRIIDVILNRVKTLELCLSANEISGTTAFAADHYALAPLDSYNAIWAFNDDRWNNELTVRILSFLEDIDFPIELIYEESVNGAPSGYRFKSLVANQSLKRKFLNYGRNCLGKLAKVFACDKDALIINSYLPAKEAIKLNFALGQCPQQWYSPNLDVTKKPDRVLRECLKKLFERKSGDYVEDIARAMIFELIPVCYLEGFEDLNKAASKQAWPKNPRFIFTSNNFDTDEIFKLWTAKKIISGTRYYAGQHGNNYGTYRYMYPSIEESTTDRFLTWGWRDGLPQHTPAFIFKVVGKKLSKNNPNGGLLLIESTINHRAMTWDVTAEFSNYFSEQQTFVNAIDDAPKQKLTIRLMRAFRYFKWSELDRWSAIDASLTIDNGELPIASLISKSRLVVHTYDSTGILETLALNVPTIAFWNDGFDHLRESAKPYYQLLVDVGIVHLSAESAARKVNEIWSDVGAWWNQNEIQEARKIFCNRYARTIDNPLTNLKLLLMKE